MRDPRNKYSLFQNIDLPDRIWPTRQTTTAPIWCSVDLRDGNQALIEPMGHMRKARMFETLVAMGFKEIEVGFPAASQTDFDFVRWLIDNGRIPDDVTIQVLTQARDHLIDRTFEAIAGCRRAVVHLYNSTSTLQRRVVFGLDRAGIVDIAVKGAERVKAQAQALSGSEIVYQYSPESFTGTELDFAKEVCEAVMDVYGPTPDAPMILNLPATVEMATPNIYADQVEWFARNVGPRDGYILSLHPHNDRGTGTAAAELGMLAGADRVEGTLFGNGERSGNVDIVNLALNLYTQGIDPGLDISDIDGLVRTAEYCNQIDVHPRHPYAGELVYTSFSGSHQDAIKKGFAAMKAQNTPEWGVPYLPLDPTDVGRSYEAVIRVNSQSGKGGVAFLLERDYGLRLPRRHLIEFSRVIQNYADNEGAEVSSDIIWQAFEREYLHQDAPALVLDDFELRGVSAHSDAVSVRADLSVRGRAVAVSGEGSGPIDAFVTALEAHFGVPLTLTNYKEHAIDTSAKASAASYIELSAGGRSPRFGAGIDPNILTASMQAIVSAVNRLVKSGHLDL